jgi:hypothetical protein
MRFPVNGQTNPRHDAAGPERLAPHATRSFSPQRACASPEHVDRDDAVDPLGIDPPHSFAPVTRWLSIDRMMAPVRIPPGTSPVQPSFTARALSWP